MQGAEGGRPITVALVNDFDVIVKGLRVMFEEHPTLRIVELDAKVEPDRPVDIALYDAFSRGSAAAADVERLHSEGGIEKLVVFTWDSDPGHVADALRGGADAYLSKGLSEQELMEALVRVHAGEHLVVPGRAPASDADMSATRHGHDWPGRVEGLTYREGEVLSLIMQGLSNQEIATRLYLSINSVKTYIRSAYRKMGVVRRGQAMVWGVDHGLYQGPSRRSGSGAPESVSA